MSIHSHPWVWVRRTIISRTRRGDTIWHRVFRLLTRPRLSRYVFVSTPGCLFDTSPRSTHSPSYMSTRNYLFDTLQIYRTHRWWDQTVTYFHGTIFHFLLTDYIYVDRHLHPLSFHFVCLYLFKCPYRLLNLPFCPLLRLTDQFNYLHRLYH